MAVSRISGEDSWSLSLADYLDSMDYYYYEGDFASICYYRDGHDFYDLPEFGLYLEAAEAWECKETAVHWWKAYGRLGETAYRDYAEHYQGRLEELAAESAYPENSTYLESFLGEAEGSSPTPVAVRAVLPSCRMPEGIRCRMVSLPWTLMVWPALLPPWKRTISPLCALSMSTIFPLPSSPHWAPIMTVFAIYPPALPAWRGPRLKFCRPHAKTP